MRNGYRYTGSGERFRGVPTRDLTQEEYDRLGPLEQRRVRESGVYEAVELKDLSMDELRAMATSAGVAAEEVEKLRTKADAIKRIDDVASAVIPTQTNKEEGGS